jgi:asparagine synthase (glutamine-hydrolysing)
MCGIAGIYAFHYAALDVDRDELRRIRDDMAARGPDGKGEWHSADSRVGLAHRRLSIIDLSDRAAQPMASADGKLVVTFNGEIYNYKALRRELEGRGHIFRTQSDTEVLLHLYAEKGVDLVHKLRGMFAFAIWDQERRTLLLGRDPYGIKPLYYANDGWTLRFASQVKALLAGRSCSRDPDPAGHVGFYLFGSVPEPYTTYALIRSLPAGTVMRVDAIGPHAPMRYFSIAEIYHSAQADARRARDRDAPQAIRDALLDSVRHHLVADVPVGAFLSAGIDSGALIGLMRDAGQQDIQTVTLSFEEFRGRAEDEAPLADQVARRFGTRHINRIVSQREFEEDLPKILAAMDQPSIDGVNTWFVSKAAHELGLKVAVSGLGGDELFGGYPSFHQIPHLVRIMAVPSRVPLLARTVRAATAKLDLAAIGLSPKFAGLLEYGGSYPGAYLLRRGLFMPWEITDLLPVEFATEGLHSLCPTEHIANSLQPDPGSSFGRVAALESSLYMQNQLLRDTDWASMAHSLEVRVPLVDSLLLKSTARQFAGGYIQSGKQLLALSPSTPLAMESRRRRKTGFGTPMRKWITKEMRTPNGRQGGKFCEAGQWSRSWARVVADASASTALSAAVSGFPRNRE